ncbi:MFS general substrate transporter [Amniculicola lignicola CBS 123094]|uniref:MFS general substrate transporter n=1 Tax=Amniculicola lignicola CBS 123094 TaxID=1392246 RepID=A0A6A5WM59_9PLEO|nr:MFS general substrate transporter [Amniculicola lignicola CBS 123094]
MKNTNDSNMTSIHQTIELRTTRPRQPSAPNSVDQTWNTPSNTEIEQVPIPPPDTGKAAWLVLAGCTLIQAPVWGYSLAFGVFQEYYTSHPTALKGDTSNVAVIGTTLTGILYLSSPFTFAILSRWPRLRRWFGPIGLVMTAAGFLMSSFATSVWQLVATQGVVSALGSGLLFTPSTLYLDEWFVRRKGLAYGIMWAGKSFTGVGIPFVMSASLQRFGPERTLQGWTVATILLSSPLLYYLRPRIPLSATTTIRRLDTTFLTLPIFWTLQMGNILQSLGYFLPYTYMSSYAVQQIGATAPIATLVLSLINATSVPGGIVMGTLNDHFSVMSVLLLSSLGSAFAVFFLWGFSSHIALLTLFALTYGFFAGGFSSTWSGVMNEIKRQSPGMDTGLMFGLLAGGRGVGNVISGPLSVALFGKGVGGSGVYEGQYGAVILFTGITALLGGWGGLGWLWKVGGGREGRW